MIEQFLSIAAAFFSGLLAGSFLLEGFVLVPFWKKLKAEEFFAFHHSFGQSLFRYFAPLTSVAVFIPIASALSAAGSNIWLNISSAASLVVISFFPFYFKAANEEFSNKLITADQLPDRLVKWGKVHTVRMVVSLFAFLSAVVGVYATN